MIPATIISTGGIRLIPFIAGEVERVLEVYAKGHSLEPTFVTPGCHGRISTTGIPAHKMLKKMDALHARMKSLS